MSDSARKFEVSLSGKGLEKSLTVQMVLWGWVIVALVLVFLIVGVPAWLTSSMKSSEKFGYETGAGLAMRAQKLDGLGRDNMLNTRSDGPDMQGTSARLTDYLGQAINEEPDTKESATSGRTGNKLSEASLSLTAQGL